MLAFRDKQHSDLNGDGKVSIKEAFEYAKRRHSWSSYGKQKPFIKGDLDPDEVFLE